MEDIILSKKSSKNKSNTDNNNDNSYKSVLKTYSIIGILILCYFLSTYSYKSVDKKMDKISGVNSSISCKLALYDTNLILSSADNFIGLTECSPLPLGRISIKSSTSKSFDETQPNIIISTIKDKENNKLIIAGKNNDFKQIVFSNIIESNGNIINNDITIDIPTEEYFIIAADYEDNYENIRIINNNNDIIKINE